MSLKPTAHIQNMHPGSRVGVEMEICLNKKKYKKLGYYEDIGSQSYKTPIYEFKGESPFKIGYPEEPGQPDLSNILLLTDASCICENESFINAEIVSPKMNSVEIPHYLNFLKTKVFNNMKEVYQGETCGIHIHWSNNDMDKYINDLNYKFLFFKFMHNLREKLDYKLINPIFSGREHFYTEDTQKKFQIIIPFDFLGDSLKIVGNSAVTIKDYKKKSLIDLAEEVNSAMITYIEPSDKLKTEKSQMKFLEEFFSDKENKEFTVFINEGVLKKRQHYNGSYNEHSFPLEDKKKIMSFLSKSTSEQHKNAVENLIKYVKTYKENRFKTLRNMEEGEDFDYTFNEKEIRDEIDELTYLIGEESVKSKKFSSDFFVFCERLDTLKLYIGEEGSDTKNIHLQDIKSLFRDRKDLIIQKEEKVGRIKKVTPQNVFNFLQLYNKKLPDLSFYDIEDGFHMEMRMFSLDTVFYKRKAAADDLLNEITKFILYTENLMMNVIAVLNEVYSPSEREGIKPKYRKFVNEVLLYGDYHTKAQQKKIFKRLFSKEEVDRSTQRNTKSVRKPSLSLRKNSKNSKSKTRKLSRRNSFNSSEEVRSAYKEYLRTMPDSE